MKGPFKYLNDRFPILGDPGAVSRVATVSGSRDFRGRKFTVYVGTRRAPGKLLLPNQLQKRLKSPLLIGQKNISEEDQPGDSDAFLHEVFFLIDRYSGQWIECNTE